MIRVGDALQNVSGVNNRGGYFGIQEQINIRGFALDPYQGSYFRDGICLFTFDFPETAKLERIEVLKGPASILFGQAQPGGIVNLVTKKPFYYRRNNWRAALNIRNLFDVEYFAGSDGTREQIQPGAPFTIGTFSLEF